MRRILFLLLLALSGLVQAQNKIEGTIQRFGGKMIFLMSIYGEKTKAIDSATTDPDGHFRFTISNRLPGMYRVHWAKDAWVDLVWNQEDVNFVTTPKNPGDSLVIISSLENKINRTYSEMDRVNQAKLQLLMPVVDFYPVKDAFYTSAVSELEFSQKLQQRYLDSLGNLYPNSLHQSSKRLSLNFLFSN